MRRPFGMQHTQKRLCNFRVAGSTSISWSLVFILIFLFISFSSAPVLADNNFVPQYVQGGTVLSQGNIASGEQSMPDLFTGSFGYQVSILTPPGRNGIQPNLVLTYSSKNGANWVGKGWQLTMGYIEIDTRFGVPKYDGTDTYRFVLNGQIGNLQEFGNPTCGILTCHTYRAEYEDTYLLFSPVPLFGWVVKDGKGREYDFGFNLNAEEYDQANSTHIARWYLTKVKDQYGNVMTIHYVKGSGGKSYISDINYTGFEGSNGSTIEQGITDVIFNTTNSLVYPNSNGRSGFLINDDRVLYSIDIEQNGKLIRSYKLGHTTSLATGEELLTSITQYGNDGVSALPSTIFGYSYYYLNPGAGPQNLFEPCSANWTNFYGNVVWNGMDDGRRFVDLNGDGLPDLLIGKGWSDSTGTSVNEDAYINNGSGWTSDNAWSSPVPFLFEYYGWYINEGVFLGDIDGDGKVDILQSCSGIWAWAGCQTNVWLNNGHGFTRNAGWAAELSSIPSLITSDIVQGTAVDVNGDGRIDIVDWSTGQVYINNGSSWVLDNTWTSNFPQETDSWAYHEFVDINGDGLPDLIASPNKSDVNKNVYVNNGHGWSYSSNYTGNLDNLLSSLAASDPDLSGVEFVDINNDGKTDVLDLITKQAYVARGTEWIYDTAWTYSLSNINTLFNGGVFADLNGDGAIDALYANQNNKYEYDNVAQPDDLLSSISNGVGGSISINYSTRKANTHTPFALPVVSSVTISDGINPTTTTFYVFAGDKYDETNRQFDGFSSAGVFYTGSHVTTTYFNQGGAYNGKVRQIDTCYFVFLLACEPIKSVRTTWNSRTVSGSEGSINVIYPQEQDDYDFLDSSGNPATPYKFIKQAVDDYGYVTDVYQGGTGTPTRHTHINYATSSNGSIVGLPDEISIQDNNGTYYKDTRYFYDGLGLGQVLQGSLTQQASWLNDAPSNSLSQGSYILTKNSYDQYGNIVSQTDANGNTTTISYDNTTHTYPYLITNALGQSMQNTYDTGFGVLLESTDVNGVERQDYYDAFGRLTTEGIYVNGTFFPLKTYSYNLNTFPNSVVKNSYEIAGNNAHLTEVDFYDGLGRSIEKKEFTGSSDIIKSAVVYNNMGQIRYQYLPYSEPSTNLYNYTTPLGAHTSTNYDALERVKETDYPDGRWIMFSYNSNGNWNATVADSSGKQTTKNYDVFGDVLSVSGDNGSASYNYNIVGELIDVTDQHGNMTTILYDTLGRKILVNASDMGVWNYAYDSNGNLITQIDGNNKITYFHYDSLNRMIIKEDPHLVSSPPGQRRKLDGSFTVPKPCNPAHACLASDPIIYYNYDEATSTNGVGRLTSITDTVAVTHYGYDVLGNVINEIKQIKVIGQSFTITRIYDLLGRLNSITYPDGEQVGYYYGDNGQLKQVIGENNYITDIEYNPVGEMTQMSLGNGIVEHYSYDPNNLRLTDIDAGGTANTILSQSYTYTQDGDISTITDNVNSTYNQQFSYDNTSRLIQATGWYGVKQYAYGSTGNLIQKDGITYTYSTVQPSAVVAGSNGFTAGYDADGQMLNTYNPINAVSYNYTYDFEGHLTSVSSSSGVSAQYYYDGTGARIAKVVGNSSTVYIDKLYEIRPTYTAKHIYALGKIIASIVNTSTGTSPSSYNPHPGGPLPPGTNVPNSHGRGWGCGLWKGGISTDSDNNKPNPLPDMLMLMLPIIVLMTMKFKKAAGKLQGIYKGIIFSVIPHLMRNPVLDGCHREQSYKQKPSLKELCKLSPHPLKNVLYIGLATAMFITAPPFTRTLQASWQDHTVPWRTTDPVYYYISDMLGSTQVVTDANGNVVTTVRYNPFGSVSSIQQVTGEYQTPYLYTSQELDGESGLYYYNARYYNPVIGRFMSADPVISQPLNPQSLNRYSYVLNNPLTYTDPSGLSWISDWWNQTSQWWTQNITQPVSQTLSQWTSQIANAGTSIGQWTQQEAFPAVGQFFSRNGKVILAVTAVIVAIVIIIVTHGAAAPAIIGMIAGGVVGGVSAAQNGGDISSIISGVLFGMALGALAGAAGGAIMGTTFAFQNATLADMAYGTIIGTATGAAYGYAGGSGSWEDIGISALIGGITGAATGGLCSAGWCSASNEVASGIGKLFDIAPVIASQIFPYSGIATISYAVVDNYEPHNVKKPGLYFGPEP